MTVVSFDPPMPSAGVRTAPAARAATGAARWLTAIVITTALGFRGPLAPHGVDLAHAVHGPLAPGWSLQLLALPPGLGRAYMGWAGVDPVVGSHLALVTGSLLLLALIVRDRRALVREPVYPMVLASLVTLQLLFPVIAGAGWIDRAARVFARA
jgi:hypothetical protein